MSVFAWLTKRGGFERGAHNNIRDARKKATYFVWPVYQNENQEVSPGDHVVAVYVDNQRPYIGKAIDVDGSDVHITFMAPYLDESHQYFRWPKSEDKIWVDSHEILCVVPEPNSNKRGFTLPEMSRKSALELYSSCK